MGPSQLHLRSRTHRAVVLVCGLLAATSARVAVADTDAGISVGAIYTDNVARVEVNQKSDVIATAGIDLAVNEHRPYFDVKAAGDVHYLDYTSGDYPHEIFGNAAGTLLGTVVPERFLWLVQENFGQQQLVLGAPDNPANRETVNFLSTGPEVSIPFTDLTRLHLTALASEVNYQHTDTDNHRLLVGSALIHDLNRTASISLNAETERVRYRNDVLNPNFDRDSAYLRYVVNGARTQIAVAGGIARTKIIAETKSRPLLRIEATRLMNARNTLKLSVAQESYDAATALRAAQGDLLDQPVLPPIQRSNDPYRVRTAITHWQYRADRTAIDLIGTEYEEKHDLAAVDDRKRLQFEARFDRAVHQRLGITASALWGRDRLAGVAGVYQDHVVTAGFRWGLGRHFTILVEAQRIERTSDTALDRYVDTRAGIFFRYGVARHVAGAAAVADAN